MSSKLQLDVVITVRGGAIWWTWTKVKGRHGVVCRLNCVLHVWAPWGRDACHLRRYINPRISSVHIFTFLLFYDYLLLYLFVTSFTYYYFVLCKFEFVLYNVYNVFIKNQIVVMICVMFGTPRKVKSNGKSILWGLLHFFCVISSSL